MSAPATMVWTSARLLTLDDAASSGAGTLRDQVIDRGAIAVEGGRVAWVGPADALPATYTTWPVRDLGGRLVTPGLVDAHMYMSWDIRRAVAEIVKSGQLLTGPESDRTALREALSSMLAREGWIVDVAEDGERAWALAEHLSYDLVVTDLEMPRLSGFELIGRLRRARRTASVTIVIVSSRVTADVRRRAAELGVKGVIAKPLTRRKLLDVLHADASPR